MNDAVNNMIQFTNANTATLTAAAAGIGFPNTGLLTNANLAANAHALVNAAQFSSAATKLPPGPNSGLNSNNLNQGFSQTLNQGLHNGLNQGLNQVLNQGLLGGLQNNLLSIVTNPSTEQHLQNLGAIIPCRARGMPADHNFKTAYFVIPDGIEHGDELVCNYPACRQAGVKFRYCLHCKIPVAKRNFRNRHRHGVPGGSPGSDSEESEEESVAPAGANPADGNVCPPAPKSAKGNDDYAGVKKEHIIVIPGAAASSNANNLPPKKKKKKSGHVRVPCRARGMPMAHNFKTAYFTILHTI